MAQPNGGTENGIEYYEFRAMNTEIVLAAAGDPICPKRTFEHIRAFIKASEARFTRFSDQSELARLNHSGGTWFHASSELYDIVRQALELHEQTNGLFDPAVLNALERAGYDRSMDEIRARGARASMQSVVQGAFRKGRRTRDDTSQIKLDPAAQAIQLPPGMRLDLGGLAKGWIAEHSAELLAAFADTCAVNAGGDLFAVGAPEHGWRIGLEDPRNPDADLAVLRTGPGAVATSSVARRRWQQNGREMHHLIDPRTGTSAETDWLSVTVIAPHSTVAEVFAKALLIAGPRDAEMIAGRRNDIAYIVVDKSGKLWGSEKSKEYLDGAASQ